MVDVRYLIPASFWDTVFYAVDDGGRLCVGTPIKVHRPDSPTTAPLILIQYADRALHSSMCIGALVSEYFLHEEQLIAHLSKKHHEYLAGIEAQLEGFRTPA